jgi:hypothetical protein
MPDPTVISWNLRTMGLPILNRAGIYPCWFTRAEFRQYSSDTSGLRARHRGRALNLGPRPLGRWTVPASSRVGRGRASVPHAGLTKVAGGP